tara:strand:- start:341 stop:985 length:645 start_codon:yes stop_codon:yes gene_type:complete
VKILIACEYSGIVRDAFAKKGHDVMSCDILPTESEGKHYQGDVFDVLHDDWDMMIAHPPCTHLSVSGARWFKDKQQEQKEALDFVRMLLDAPIKHIALENPVSVISSKIRKPDQIIQPWQFGHEAQKTTCLWLKNLPHLKHTKVVSKGEFTTFKSGKKHPKWYADALKLSKHERMKVRSKTFQGIAQAMAEQWSKPYEDFKQIEMDLRMIVSTD